MLPSLLRTRAVLLVDELMLEIHYNRNSWQEADRSAYCGQRRTAEMEAIMELGMADSIMPEAAEDRDGVRYCDPRGCFATIYALAFFVNALVNFTDNAIAEALPKVERANALLSEQPGWVLGQCARLVCRALLGVLKIFRHEYATGAWQLGLLGGGAWQLLLGTGVFLCSGRRGRPLCCDSRLVDARREAVVGATRPWGRHSTSGCSPRRAPRAPTSALFMSAPVGAA